MKTCLSWLLASYVAINGSTGIVVFGTWVTPPIVVLLISVMVFVAAGVACEIKPNWKVFGVEDLILALMLAWWCTSAILNFNEKAFQYVGMYFFVFGVSFWALKMMLAATNSTEMMLKANVAGVATLSVFAIGDSLALYIFSVDLQDSLPRIKEATAVYGGVIRRAYSLAPEPTVFGYYLNTLGPLALWWVWRRAIWPAILKVSFSVTVLLAWLLTLSVATFLFLCLSVGACVGIQYIRNVLLTQPQVRQLPSHRRWLYLAMPAALLAIIALLLGAKLESDPALKRTLALAASPMTAKVMFGPSKSASQRLERWREATTSVRESPVMGKGPGYYASRDESSSINWYLFIGAEGGVVAAFLGICFLGVSLFKVISSTPPWRFVVVIGAFAGGLHFLVIATVQHPSLWTLLAIHSVASLRTQIENECN